MAKIGTGQITLADLTDERPVRLDLATSLRIIQSQTGSVYDPDYSLGDGQVITPSLFFGHSEVAPDKYLNQIYYNCSDEGDEVDYKFDPSFDPTKNENISYVDNLGRFHLKRNLNESIVIEANINIIVDEQTGVEYNSITERITLHKVSYESGYSNFIISKDGRYDFDSDNSSDIILISKLYYGAEEINNKIISRNWYKSADDEQPLTDNSDGSLTVSRKDVFGHETFICETIIEGGLKFRAQIGIDDRTDSFSSVILATGTTILTPLNNQVKLNCQIWRGNDIYSEGDITYNWYYIVEGDSIDLVESEENSSSFLAILDGNILPKKSLTLYCQAEIKENEVVIGKPINFISIQYTNPYTVTLTPDTIFIPANSDGSFRGKEFSQDFSFEIRGEDGELLPYDDENDNFILPQDDEVNEDNKAIIFEETTTTEFSSVWKRTFNLKIDTSKKLGNWESKNFEVGYQYLGVSGLVKTFNVLKNFQGVKGEQGYSGFTIDLTNSFHKFAGEERYAFLDQETKFSYTAMIADQNLNIVSIKVNDKVFYNKDISSTDFIEISTGLFLKYEHSSKTFTLATDKSTSTNPKYLETLNGSFSILFEVSHSSMANNKTFSKNFNYGYTQTGNSYHLYINPTELIYSPSTDSFSQERITVSAQYQSGGKGAFFPYTSAKIYYSIDKENFKNLNLTNGAGTIENSELNSLTKQVTIRMYLSNATGVNDTRYLMDEETIPIVTSLDGAQIGGENLIKWSKNLTLEENKWTGSTGASIGQDGDFSYLNFDDTIKTSTFAFFSPKMLFDSDYLNKNFCLSFWVYSDDWNTIDGGEQQYFAVQLRGFEKYDTTTRYLHKQIGYIYRGGETTFSKEEEGLLPTGKWIKIYKTFSLDNFSFVEGDTEKDLSKCKYFCIMFYTKYNGVLRIKKPKLEFGNIPTDWSPSPYDISLENITGINLLSFGESFKVEIPEKEIYKDFEIELKKGKNYTISWSSTSSTNSNTSKFYCRLYIGSVSKNNLNEEPKVNKTYNIDQTQVSFLYSAEDTSTYTLRFYAKNSTDSNTSEKIFTIKQLKVELGEIPTNYYVTGDLIQDIVSNIEEDSASMGERVGIIETDKEEMTTNLKNLKETIENLSGSSVDINEVNGAISLYTKNFYEGIKDEADLNYKNSLYFTQIKNAIDLVTDSEDGAYIQISSFIGNQTDTAAVKNFYTKITSDRLSFYGNNKEVAFISGENLQIKNAHFLNSFIIGEENTSGELKVYLTESGIGLGWVK